MDNAPLVQFTSREMCSFLDPFIIIDRTVADPGFPGVGGGGWVGYGANLLFGIMFDENCMDMKTNWTKGGAFFTPPRSATAKSKYQNNVNMAMRSHGI